MPAIALAMPGASHALQVVALRSTSAYYGQVAGRDTREITQRELRNESAAILRGVERGESFVITRNGTPVGRLTPIRRRVFVPRSEVLAAFASAPVLDAERLRTDLDQALDAELPDREW